MMDMSSLKARDWVNNLRSLIIVLALSFHAVFEASFMRVLLNLKSFFNLLDFFRKGFRKI
jgi:hypothetical protein